MDSCWLFSTRVWDQTSNESLPWCVSMRETHQQQQQLRLVFDTGSHFFSLCALLQVSAVAATTKLLESSLSADTMPQLNIQQACHSQLQALVGSNLASLVAFNLGYLPGGDKRVITRTESTVAAVEAALEVCNRQHLRQCTNPSTCMPLTKQSCHSKHTTTPYTTSTPLLSLT